MSINCNNQENYPNLLRLWQQILFCLTFKCNIQIPLYYNKQNRKLDFIDRQNNRKYNCRLYNINPRFILFITLNNSSVSMVTDAFKVIGPHNIVNYAALITVISRLNYLLNMSGYFIERFQNVEKLCLSITITIRSNNTRGA